MSLMRLFLCAALLSVPLAAQSNPCTPLDKMTPEHLRAAVAKANDARVAANKKALEALRNEIAQRGNKSGMSEQAWKEVEARTAQAYRDAKAANDAHRPLMKEGQRRMEAAQRAREAQRAAQQRTGFDENWNRPNTPSGPPMGPGNENRTIPGEPPSGWGDGGPRSSDPALADTIPGRPPTGSGASGPPSTGSRGGGGGDPALEDTLPGWEQIGRAHV